MADSDVEIDYQDDYGEEQQSSHKYSKHPKPNPIKGI